MPAILVAIISLGCLTLGYLFYSRQIEKLWDIDYKAKTPAFEKYDGVDYVPAKSRLVLFGHHFASIAGAAPVIGPVIAVSIWGWGPALLWIIIGSVFIGAVHDFGALIISVRKGGNSIAEVTENVISHRAKIVFLLFVWCALILIVAVFIFLCAKTLSLKPETVLPSIGLIPIAVLTGYLLYKKQANQLLVTVSALVLLVLFIILGRYIKIDFGANGIMVWSIILLIYCYIASITPVQILLQPRDYLSSFLLIFGVVFGYLGLFISNFTMNLPCFIPVKANGVMKLWPMLFVTIACGAVSGFHSLIASGTTSKQITNETDARSIGYGAMIAEGVVAVLAVLTVSAGLANKHILSVFLTNTGIGPIGAFGIGYGNLTKIFLGSFGVIIAVTVLNAFILTTLDTATRISRYLTQELFRIKNRYVSTFIVVFCGGALGLSGKWKQIWPVFGASNQLIAALTLLVISSWLLSRGKTIKFTPLEVHGKGIGSRLKRALLLTGYTFLSAVFMLITTIGALVYQIIDYINQQSFLLLGIAVILIGLALFILWEIVFNRRQKTE